MQKKPPFINIVIAALLAVLTVLIGLLSGFAPNEPFPAVTPYLRLTWPLLGVATLAFIGLTIWQTLRQSASDDDKSVPRSEHRQQKQNRQSMLERVHAFWIKGALEQSLHGAALIALGLHEQPDAVENPWRLVLQEANQTTRPLPPGTRITQVYDYAGGELLILGEPGSGKTTLLLELTRDLLGRAKKDDILPMPVVFNLSSWAVKRQPLAAWLVEELNTKYQVPRKFGQAWINDDQVLLLLDGLDEVISDYRSVCVDAINTYRRDHGLVSIVVCSRSTEYFNQTSRVLLGNAVIVQPLTAQQIGDYLASAGGQLAAVREGLRKDTELRELAATPLVLSVLTLTYHGRSVADLSEAGSFETQRRQLFAAYVQRMLGRRSVETRYTPQQTMRWLIWLAQQMKKQSQTEFYIEQIQTDWFHVGQWEKPLGSAPALLAGLIAWLIFGLFGWLFVGLLKGLLVGLFGGLLSGLLIEIIFAISNSLVADIEPAWAYEWSWTEMATSLGFGKDLFWMLVYLASITAFGLVTGLTIGLISGLISGLIAGLLSGLVNGLLVLLLFGVTNTELDKQTYIRPNQGILNSARSSPHSALSAGRIIDLFIERPQQSQDQPMQRLKTQYDGERDSISLHMEQLDAFKTLKDESRIVGRAVGLWT
jgi:hypothetical protein